MEIFNFLKEYAKLENGDLILLLAFKKNWRLRIRDCMNKLDLPHGQVWRILEILKAHGICRKEIVKGIIEGKRKRIGFVNMYIFNNSGVKIVNKIFKNKILPKYPITPEDFLKNDEVDIFFQIK